MRTRIVSVLCVLFLLSAFVSEKKRSFTVFMIGDSTMANKSLKNGNIERGWGQALPEFLVESILVDNHAKDGRSSKSFINEGRWNEVLSRLKKGDYVFIQFGHNDEKTAEELHTIPGGTFDDNLRRFVRETRAKGAHPVLMNSIVRRNFPPEGSTEHKGSYEEEGDVLVDTHGAYLDSPRNVAKEMNVPFIDMNKLTYDLVMGMGIEQSKSLFMWVPAGVYDFCLKGKIDNTHLTVLGAKEVARLAIKAVAEVIPEFNRYTRNCDSDVYVANYKGDRKCAISYTFDDGLQEHYTLVFPAMEKLGFKGTFWIWGKCIENETEMLGKPRITWTQMKEMVDKGHEISNHGWSHINLKNSSTEEIKMEIARNDSVIEARLGKKPLTFCYPFNAYNEEVLRIAVEDRAGTRTEQYSIGGDKSKSTPESLDKWVRELIISGGWSVAMIHGISTGYDAFSSPDILWDHFERVKEQEDKIWVGTFCEVASYVKERNNLQLNIKKEKSSLKITPSLIDLDPQLFTESLTMVVKRSNRSKIKVTQDGRKLPVIQQKEKAVFDFNPFGGVIQVKF